MLTLRSVVFTLTLLTIFYINGVSNVQAQAMRLISLSEIGNINGETIYSIADIGFELRAVPATNNQGDTWSWTISSGYVLTEGTLISRNIRVKWTKAGNNSVSVTYQVHRERLPPRRPLSLEPPNKQLIWQSCLAVGKVL